MDFDLDAAVAFARTHARVLDRRRLDLLTGRQDATGVLAALEAYRNPDGGYGWGLEPDLRSAASQPVGAMHALEVFAEAGDRLSTRPIELCDWLLEHTFADGGSPFALSFDDTSGSAPHWIGADPTASSLTMTAQLAAQAHRLARRREDVAAHPWLAVATRYCLGAIEEQQDDDSNPYGLMFALRFLDAAAEREPRAAALLDRVVAQVVSDGPTPVPGGTEDESLHLLDFTPYADAPSRARFTPTALDADLRRLAGKQAADGGWTVDYATYSAAAALEWRGYVTVQAVAVLSGARRVGGGRWGTSRLPRRPSGTTSLPQG